MSDAHPLESDEEKATLEDIRREFDKILAKWRISCT